MSVEERAAHDQLMRDQRNARKRMARAAKRAAQLQVAEEQPAP